MKRHIIVGDVHGCLIELKQLLKKIKYLKTDYADRLYFVGDLINKGPSSLETLNFVKQLSASIVLGNHELAFLKHYKTPDNLPSNSSLITTFEQITDNGDDLEYWAGWIKTWPLFIETSNFIIVHGGITPNIPLENTPAEILCNIRTWDGVGDDLNNQQHPAWYELYCKQKLVIYGHWAMQGLNVRNNSIGLDSGCVYGKQLSAAVLTEKDTQNSAEPFSLEIIQVDSNN